MQRARSRPSESRCARSRPSARELGAQVLVLVQPRHRRRPARRARRAAPRRRTPRRVPGLRTARTGDARRHRLRERQAEALVARTGARAPRRRRAARAGAAASGRGSPTSSGSAVRARRGAAGQHERQRVLAAGGVAPVRLEQRGHALARLVVADVEEVARLASALGDRRAAPGPGPCGATTTRSGSAPRIPTASAAAARETQTTAPRAPRRGAVPAARQRAARRGRSPRAGARTRGRGP